jgi:hypothetical protein
MRDLQLNFFFNLSGHTGHSGDDCALDNLDSTDSREQTQKAWFVSSPRNFESDALLTNTAGVQRLPRRSTASWTQAGLPRRNP